MRLYNLLVVTITATIPQNELEAIAENIGDTLKAAGVGELDSLRLAGDADEVRFRVWRPMKARDIVEDELQRRGLIPGAILDLRYSPDFDADDRLPDPD